jgi:hypothetical protein
MESSLQQWNSVVASGFDERHHAQNRFRRHRLTKKKNGYWGATVPVRRLG